MASKLGRDTTSDDEARYFGYPKGLTDKVCELFFSGAVTSIVRPLMRV